MPVLLANATADAAGKATITFPAPGQGIAYCGTVIVPSTPGGAAWTAMIGNATYGQWSGSAMAGPFTENDQETLQLVGTGLVAGTTYVATWHITQGASGSFRGVVPDVLPASISIANATVPVTGTVDATIQNATLDVTGSNVTVENASGSVLSTIVTEEVIAGPQPQSILGGVATVPAGASPIVIVPAVSGQSIRLFSFILTSNGSGFIYMALQTTGGTNLLAIPPAASGVATPFPLIVPPAGIVLPAGEGIQLVQDNASSTEPAYYSLAYTQAVDP